MADHELVEETAESFDGGAYGVESDESDVYDTTAAEGEDVFAEVVDVPAIGVARPYTPDVGRVGSGPNPSTQIVPVAPVAMTPPPLPTLAGTQNHPGHPGQFGGQYGYGGQIVVAPPREGCSVASAVCGITGFIPFISQAAGLGLGIAGLVRINRARKRGVPMRGVGWAVTGLSTSVFGLLCWLGVLGGMFFLRSTIEQATSGLDLLNLPVKSAPGAR